MRQMTKLVERTLTRKLYVEKGMGFHKVRDTDRKIKSRCSSDSSMYFGTSRIEFFPAQV